MTIKIDGSATRSFIFPASRDTAFAYYRQIEHVFSLLPHISLTQPLGEDGYRMLYNTVELGIYRIQIYCDLQARSDFQNYVLCFEPANHTEPVAGDSGVYSSTCQGVYTSRSEFFDEGHQTRVCYSLSLKARLPVPVAAALMLPTVRDRIAASITTWRIRDIADGFIHQSIQDFQNGNGP